MRSVSTLDGSPAPRAPYVHAGSTLEQAFLRQGSQGGILRDPAAAVRLTSPAACGEVVATAKRKRSMSQGACGGSGQGKGLGQDEQGGTVSLLAEVPEPLLRAMRGFIERHPNWDQYRLFQAALAGFLVQNGVHNRAVTRCYLANLFPGGGRFAGPPAPQLPTASPAPSVAAHPASGVTHPTSASAWPRRRSHRSSPPGSADLGRQAA